MGKGGCVCYIEPDPSEQRTEMQQAAESREMNTPFPLGQSVFEKFWGKFWGDGDGAGHQEFLFLSATRAVDHVNLKLAVGTATNFEYAQCSQIDFRSNDPFLFQNMPRRDGSASGSASADSDDDGGDGGGDPEAAFFQAETERLGQLEDALESPSEGGEGGATASAGGHVVTLVLDSPGDEAEEEGELGTFGPVRIHDDGSDEPFKPPRGPRRARIHVLGAWSPRCDLVWRGFRLHLERGQVQEDNPSKGSSLLKHVKGLGKKKERTPRRLPPLYLTVSRDTATTKSANKR